MLVKIEARILIFPGTDFYFPSTSVPPGTFFRLCSFAMDSLYTNKASMVSQRTPEIIRLSDSYFGVSNLPIIGCAQVYQEQSTHIHVVSVCHFLAHIKPKGAFTHTRCMRRAITH